MVLGDNSNHVPFLSTNIVCCAHKLISQKLSRLRQPTVWSSAKRTPLLKHTRNKRCGVELFRYVLQAHTLTSCKKAMNVKLPWWRRLCCYCYCSSCLSNDESVTTFILRHRQLVVEPTDGLIEKTQCTETSPTCIVT